MKKLFVFSLIFSFILFSTVDSYAFKLNDVPRDQFTKVMDKYQLEKLFGNNNYKKLIEKCNELIKNDDDVVKFVAWSYLGEVYSRDKQIDETKKVVENLYALNEDGRMASAAGLRFLSRIGEDKKAISDFMAVQKKRHEAENKEFDKKQYLLHAKTEVAKGVSVSPQKIWNDFNDNEVAAEDEYKGHILGVEGKIGKITTSPMGYPEITFNVDKYGLNSVTFQFDKENRKEIAKLKKGKNITLGGECIGFTMGTIVMFKDAFIVE